MTRDLTAAAPGMSAPARMNPMTPQDEWTETVRLPRVPTEAMIRACLPCHVGGMLQPAEVAALYRAMIAAAPPGTEEGGGLWEALPDLTAVINWLANGCAVEHAVTELKIHQARIDQALARDGGKT